MEAPWEDWEAAAAEVIDATATSSPVDAFALARACHHSSTRRCGCSGSTARSPTSSDTSRLSVTTSHARRRAGAARLPGVDVAVPCVNATELVSEIGNELAREAPFAIVWHEDGEGQLHYSLRSRSDNPAHADVAAIARGLGGGGHKHAAGFHAP
jgi:nanoRNase/pAp phosphatase (c-di-AMP/oligoRNAs hydrolase)